MMVSMSSLFAEVTEKSKAKRAELNRNTAVRKEAAAKQESDENIARARAILDTPPAITILT